MNDTTRPDYVYSIWLMTGIKKHQVMGLLNGNRLAIRHNGSYTAGASLLDNGTYKWESYIYYPTWEAAHTAAIAKCQMNIAKAEIEIRSNRRAIKKLEALVKEG